MKQKIFTFLLQFVFIFILVTSLVYWGETKNQSLSITLSVEPVRTIIVDRNLQIVTIMSNTKEDVRPVVFLDTQDGAELPYTEGIAGQYNTLKPVVNFEKPGIVYQRDTRVTLAVFKTTLNFIQKLLHISF